MKRLETENKNTREYYDQVLVSHFEEQGLDYTDAARIQILLKIFPGGKLLDIGCGISPLCLDATTWNDSEIWGMDFSEKIISILKEKYPNINYVVGEFNKMPFEDEYFDCVILGEIIEHVEHPKRVIEEAFRVLKKGGWFALSTPNEETKDNHIDEQHIWGFEQKDMKELIGEERLLGITIWSNNIIAYAQKN